MKTQEPDPTPGNTGGANQTGGDAIIIPTPNPNDVGKLNEGVREEKPKSTAS